MDGGNCELFLNPRLERSRLSEAPLSEQIGVRYGFCGAVNQSSFRAAHEHGRKTILLSLFATSGNQ
jgi:hypothetical protein